MGMRFFIGVASREHVLMGVRGGFAQFGHGKMAPAKRLARGDWVIYYSSKDRISEALPCQRFTALGRVVDDEPVQVEQAPRFTPWRRRMEYLEAREVEIRPLLDHLSFITDKSKWGAVLRFGLVEIPHDDFMRIAKRMVPAFEPP
jgi:predicted RNA-binding protein